MADKDFTKTSGGGMTREDDSQLDVQLTPGLRPVFQNAGFPEEGINGETLLEGHAQGFGLRDGDNSQAHGTQPPTYPTDLMGEFAKGEDLRNFSKE
jgi:hypothetical protein